MGQTARLAWAAITVAAVLLAACGGGGGSGGDPVQPPDDPDPPAAFTLDEDWVTGLSEATSFAPTPDGRFLVAEQGGTLRVVKEGRLLPAPFVRLADVDSQGERGLIGVAIDPDFASNGFVYLHHTTTAGGVHNRVSRFTAVGDAAAGAGQTILELPMLSGATNHNGGALHFGRDGKLFVAVGENAQPARAQDLGSPLGKLLRINRDGTVPGDNPFSGTLNDERIWAYGLRNPFTFAVQPGTGKIHINDVGQTAWEEINLGAAGANFGWPASEGPDNVSAGVTAPIYVYENGEPDAGTGGEFGGCSIAGGAFYPSSGNFPASHHGSYFFADFCAGFVARLPAGATRAEPFAQLSGNPVDLRVGGDGALYVLTRTGIARISAR